jgi:hypothetical protein
MDYLQAIDSAHVAEAKVLDYLLALDHPVGGPKARFFLNRGFNREEWAAFAAALLSHARANRIANSRTDTWGTRYTVDCSIITPDETNPCIRVVWQVTPEDPSPRLITAHPVG